MRVIYMGDSVLTEAYVNVDFKNEFIGEDEIHFLCNLEGEQLGEYKRGELLSFYDGYQDVYEMMLHTLQANPGVRFQVVVAKLEEDDEGDEFWALTVEDDDLTQIDEHSILIIPYLPAIDLQSQQKQTVVADRGGTVSGVTQTIK